MSTENILFEATDKTGRLVYLTKERWHHILKHPEMIGQLERIQDALIKPLLIKKAEFDRNLRYYYSYFKDRTTANYLLVLVKYLNGKGFVITAFYTNKIKGQNERKNTTIL